jgi:hypothetical protein
MLALLLRYRGTFGITVLVSELTTSTQADHKSVHAAAKAAMAPRTCHVVIILVESEALIWDSVLRNIQPFSEFPVRRHPAACLPSLAKASHPGRNCETGMGRYYSRLAF